MLAEVEKLVSWLTAARIKYCVVGGVAVLLYGGRASTIDFDFYILVEDEAKLRTLLKAKGIAPRSAGEFQLKFKVGEMPVDVLIADEWVGLSALARGKKRRLGSRDVVVASPEDVIIMKVIADRPIDRRDVAELEEIFGSKLDRRYIARRLKAIRKALS